MLAILIRNLFQKVTSNTRHQVQDWSSLESRCHTLLGHHHTDLTIFPLMVRKINVCHGNPQLLLRCVSTLAWPEAPSWRFCYFTLESGTLASSQGKRSRLAFSLLFSFTSHLKLHRPITECNYESIHPIDLVLTNFNAVINLTLFI